MKHKQPQNNIDTGHHGYLRADFLAQVESGTDFLHLLLGSQRPKTLEFGIVEGQADRKDLGQEIQRSQSAVIIYKAVSLEPGKVYICLSIETLAYR